MEKIYLKWLCITIFFACQLNVLRSQTCTTPTAPAVSGTTIAPCVSSSSFTLTATGTNTNPINWYSYSYGGNAVNTGSVFTTPTFTSGSSATYYVGQSVSLITTSIALPTFYTAYSGNTRGMWFTAPMDFIITGLRVPTDVGGTSNSGLAVMKFPSTPPTYASVTNSFTTLYLNQSITGTNVVTVNIPVYTGDIIGILGERGSNTSYASTNPVSTTIGTTAITIQRLGMQYDLTTQTPLDLWTEVSTGNVGRIEVYTTLGCLSTLTPVTVTVTSAPHINISGPTSSICANSSFTLNASGVSTYTWANGPQTSSFVVTPSVNTTYSVSGSISPGCSSVSAITISVDLAAPVVTALSSSSVICSGNTLNLSGVGATTYTWTGGAGSITNNVAFVPNATANYTVRGSNSCGTNSAATSVTVNPTPTLITTASSSVICYGDLTNLSVSGALTYTWSPGAIVNSSIAVSPTTSVLYIVNGLSNFGCPASSSQIVLVNPTPTITAATSKTLVCVNGAATLTTSGATTYSWNTGTQSPVTIVNTSVNTIYSVTGTYTSTGCHTTNTVAVNVFVPVLSISSLTAACQGAVVTLTAYAGSNSNYMWSTGSPFASITVTATVPSSYSVAATTSTTGGLVCPSTGSVQVNVYPNPTVTASSTRTLICKGEKTIINAGGAVTYTWSGSTAGSPTLQVSPTIQTNYVVTGTDANGCVNQATIAVKVNVCTGLNELQNSENIISVYPNPNNGEFVIHAKGAISLKLVNELCQVIRELNLTESNNYTESIGSVASGIYFIIGTADGAQLNQKVIVYK
jgi:hypothetical protein